MGLSKNHIYCHFCFFLSHISARNEFRLKWESAYLGWESGESQLICLANHFQVRDENQLILLRTLTCKLIFPKLYFGASMNRDYDDEMQFLFSFSYESLVMGRSKGSARGALPAVEQFLLLPAHLSKGVRLLVKLRSISRDLIKVHWPLRMLIWNHWWSRNYVNFMELCLTRTCNWKGTSSFSPTFINRHMYFGPLTISFYFKLFM